MPLKTAHLVDRNDIATLSKMASLNRDERTPLLAAQPRHNDGSSQATVPVGQDEDLDFDARFRKWKAAVARKFRGGARREAKPALLITHFDGVGQARAVLEAKRASASRELLHEAISMTSAEFQQQVEQVRHAITQGVNPKMITTGSSGSYFARIISEPLSSHVAQSLDTTPTPVSARQYSVTTVAVFKPKDEEPYGNLNPKRQFLRKYLWWAMGRPCLIPNFSYLSEVGASYLDSRLGLGMVPRTELVELSSPSFHYAFKDRMAFEKEGVPLPSKIGSYQTFLNGYVNASDFLRRHPWPSRTRSKTLLIRDVDEESRAHKVSRRKERARLRNCGVAIKRALLCRPSWEDIYGEDEIRGSCTSISHRSRIASDEETSSSGNMDVSETAHDGFYWTPKRMEHFRLQLEKLVVLDFLMRNTDRGLDNFMVKCDTAKDEIKIGAIDNSLSFPIKHPNEIRQYPFGWLFLPSDLIGLPFSASTREHLLPILSDPAWWQHTVQGLRRIFEQDPYFDEAKFERQMGVMRGQGWNLVQSLQSSEEGPLDLCAREKKLIRQEVQELSAEALERLDGVKVPLDSNGQVLPISTAPESPGFANPATGKPSISRTISSGAIEAGRRPIGMRASESYKKALQLAAGTEAAIDLGEQMQDQAVDDTRSTFESGASTSLPQTSPLKDKMQPDPFAEGVQQESDRTWPSQKTRHLRIASAHDVGTLNRRERDAMASGSGLADEGDCVLGRTGIEILEGLDRERKQRHKFLFFRQRQRSSTISNEVSAQPGGSRKLWHQTRQSSEEDAGRTGGERSWDLSSSIVSDPGVNHDRPSRWPRFRPVTRPAEGMAGSLYDLHSQDHVLSEEEEDDDEERTAYGSKGGAHAAIRGPAPSITSVLQGYSSVGDANAQDDTEDRSRPGTFAPHIPHPKSLSRTEDPAYANAREPASTSSKRTVKVIVERISSDTKQAWLKWI